MLVSIARYREITGDTTSATAVVDQALEDAQRTLEEQLRRPLEQAARTERMRVFADGRVYPSATPIVTAAAGATIAGHSILDAGPAGSFLLSGGGAFASVTYTGGFDATAALGDVDRLPVELEKAIAWAAYADLHRAALSAPVGATSASVGDVSVSWGPGGSPAQGEVVFDRSLVSRYRRRLELVS